MLSPLWKAVHGEERIELPALPQLLPVLWEMGIFPNVEMVPATPRYSPNMDAAIGIARHMLHVEAGSEKDERLQKAARELAVRDAGGRDAAATGGAAAGGGVVAAGTGGVGDRGVRGGVRSRQSRVGVQRSPVYSGRDPAKTRRPAPTVRYSRSSYNRRRYAGEPREAHVGGRAAGAGRLADGAVELFGGGDGARGVRLAVRGHAARRHRLPGGGDDAAGDLDDGDGAVRARAVERAGHHHEGARRRAPTA